MSSLPIFPPLNEHVDGKEKKFFFQASVNVNPRYLYFKGLYQYGELLPFGAV